MNDNPDSHIPDEFRDLPTPTEAVDEELRRLHQAEGPPLVSDELADHIWQELPVEEDSETWERIARESQNDWLLANSLLELETLEHRQSHPSFTPLSKERYEAKKSLIAERIERRREQLDELRKKKYNN